MVYVAEALEVTDCHRISILLNRIDMIDMFSWSVDSKAKANHAERISVYMIPP